MTLLLEVEFKGYSVTAYADQDAANPLTDADCQPVVVLHDKANRRFGWTTDDDWGRRLNDALDQIAERGVTRRLRGKGGALDVIDRWLRVCYQTRSFPFSAIDHSGVAVYLGSSAHSADPGGWDSGWVGWILYNAEMAQYPEITAEQLDDNMRAAFEEFSCWVAGDTFGYRISDPDGEEIEEVWGFYGLDGLSDDDGWLRHEVESTIRDHIAKAAL